MRLDPTTMTESEREEVQTLIRHTVQETLLQLGVDTSNPEAVVEFQKDMHLLRNWRGFVEGTGEKAWYTIVGTFFLGLLTILWQAVSHARPTN